MSEYYRACITPTQGAESLQRCVLSDRAKPLQPPEDRHATGPDFNANHIESNHESV